MNPNLKRTQVLYHSTKEFAYLQNIIPDKGFKASYADEIIDNFRVKILMVSFSNVALFESKTQINYGGYSIGLTKKWGEKNGLEPIIYTYPNSEIGTSFLESLKASAFNEAHLEHIPDFPHKNTFANRTTILFDNSLNMIMYLKPTIITNKAGEKFVAYNDREWRFVHKHQKDFDPIIFEKNIINDKPEEQFKIAERAPKPLTEKPVLNFKLKNIKSVVVQEKSEKPEIIKSLKQAFGADKVQQKLNNGDLDVIVNESMWHNF
jgi:hypothetical protein